MPHGLQDLISLIKDGNCVHNSESTGPNHWCLVAQLCPTLCDPMDYSPLGSSAHGDSPSKNTGVGVHFLLQWIFPTQESNPGLSHHRQILYHLSHEEHLFNYKKKKFRRELDLDKNFK